MKTPLLRTACLLAAVAAFNGLVWQWLGVISIVTCAPLYAIVLARPLMALLSHAYQLTRSLAFRNISGRHFEHRGFMLDIVEDADCYRWLRIEDVRKIIPGLPSDQSLQHRFPGGVVVHHFARIKAETLAVYLAKSTDPSSLKFKHWLEKDVAFPARQMRERSRVSELS